jgi:tetratricopeptide (TPR) repeat protein
MKRILALFLLLGAGSLRATGAAHTVLVFPFENQSARSDLQWISESFADVVSSRLSGPDRYVVSRPERNSAFEQMGIPPGASLTLASKFKLAESVGADWAVVGGFDVSGDRLLAHAQLLDVGRLKLFAPLETSGTLTDLVDLQTRLAWRLLATYDSDFTVGTEEDFRRRFPEVRLDAFENYIRGILSADAETKMRFLREADRLNPSDRRAALELGRYYCDEKDYVNSARWVRKLDARDPGYNQALFLLGVDEFFMERYATAEKAFAELTGRLPLGEVRNNLGVLRARRGHFSDALSDFQAAYQGDPSDADYCFNLAACLFSLNRLEESSRYLEEAIRLTPDDAEFHSLLARVSGQLGRHEVEQRELRWLEEREENASTPEAEGLKPNFRLKTACDPREARRSALAVQRAE